MNVNTAVIHADIKWNDKENNIKNLKKLNEEAAKNGAKIIVNTEMAVSGYSFKNRKELSDLVETIPGPTTKIFGDISKRYACYICLGMPEKDSNTNIYYNSVVVLGPDGKVKGKYRKIAPAFRENLWASRGNLPVLVLETEFGKMGVIICADSYSYKPARIAAIEGAKILLIPANWPPEHHNPEFFWRARAAENDVHLLVCNRTGMDREMDCQNSSSYVINNQGKIIKKIGSQKDVIIYHTVPLEKKKDNILSDRNPSVYSNISLDTYSQFSPEFMLGLPEKKEFTAANIQFKTNLIKKDNIDKMMKIIDEAGSVNLMVFPELAVTGPVNNLGDARNKSEVIPGPTTDKLIKKAAEKNLYIIFGMIEKYNNKLYNSAVLIGPKGVEGVYRKVHLDNYDKNWAEKGNDLKTFNLPFARIGILIGNDLMFPEASESLSKLGADMLCVPAFWLDKEKQFIWKARLAEQMHLSIANQWGIFGNMTALGNSMIHSYCKNTEQSIYRESPSDGDDIKILKINTKDVREKKFIENINYNILLK